jgi:hypothetical protein
MRILNLQNAVLVSLTVAGVALGASLSACSSSDTPRPTADGGATGTAGASNTAGSGNATAGGGDQGTAGSTPAGGGDQGTAGSTPAGGGAGGGSAGGAATGPSVCDGLASRVLMATPADAFIDDFEMEQMNVTTMMLDPTAAAPGWYGFNDITPPNSVQMLRAAGGAATTMFSGHYAGMGAKTPVAGGYGVGVEINVGVAKDLTPPQYCVDASAFTGVSFWAKAAAVTNAKISAGFVVPSQNQVMNNGDCPDTAPAAKCNNYPQKNFVLTTDWAQYTVTFAEVTGSTGAKVVDGKVQQILFLAPTANWDFSLDEVAFYSGTAPTGPVAPPAAAAQ